MTILSIIQAVCPAIGLPIPSVAMGSNSAQVRTLVALAKTGGRALARGHPWQILTRRRTFAGNAANAQTADPPTDFHRFTPVQRIWSENQRTWLIGPASPNEWDGIMIRPQIAVPGYWCMLQGKINIAPAPAVTESFTYSYVTEKWVRPEGAATDFSGDIINWAADTDTALLDESLLELDLIWRWKQAKGLDYAEDMATFEREKEKVIARDRGPKEISLTDPYSEGPPPGWWPGQITEAP